jgi:hypothetical protein
MMPYTEPRKLTEAEIILAYGALMNGCKDESKLAEYLEYLGDIVVLRECSCSDPCCGTVVFKGYMDAVKVIAGRSLDGGYTVIVWKDRDSENIVKLEIIKDEEPKVVLESGNSVNLSECSMVGTFICKGCGEVYRTDINNAHTAPICPKSSCSNKSMEHAAVDVFPL